MTALDVVIDLARRIAIDAPAQQSTHVFRAGIQWSLIHDLRNALKELDEGHLTTKLNVCVPPNLLLDWNSQARQYDASGPEGLSYFKGDLSDWHPGQHVDCLLYRVRGTLVGILNHYAFDFTPYEVAGNVNILVRPDTQRTGIGRELLAEADRRWSLNFEQQRYTPAGTSLVRAYLNQNH